LLQRPWSLFLFTTLRLALLSNAHEAPLISVFRFNLTSFFLPRHMPSFWFLVLVKGYSIYFPFFLGPPWKRALSPAELHPLVFYLDRCSPLLRARRRGNFVLFPASRVPSLHFLFLIGAPSFFQDRPFSWSVPRSKHLFTFALVRISPRRKLVAPPFPVRGIDVARCGLSLFPCVLPLLMLPNALFCPCTVVAS